MSHLTRLWLRLCSCSFIKASSQTWLLNFLSDHFIEGFWSSRLKSEHFQIERAQKKKNIRVVNVLATQQRHGKKWHVKKHDFLTNARDWFDVLAAAPYFWNQTFSKPTKQLICEDEFSNGHARLFQHFDRIVIKLPHAF